MRIRKEPYDLMALASEAGLERCGLLFSKKGVVVRAPVVRNRSEKPKEKFDMAPVDVALEVAVGLLRGERVAGIWHTHPRYFSTTPSPADFVLARRINRTVRGAHFVIFRDGRAAAWRMAGEGAGEVMKTERIRRI